MRVLIPSAPRRAIFDKKKQKTGNTTTEILLPDRRLSGRSGPPEMHSLQVCLMPKERWEQKAVYEGERQEAKADISQVDDVFFA